MNDETGGEKMTAAERGQLRSLVNARAKLENGKVKVLIANKIVEADEERGPDRRTSAQADRSATPRNRWRPGSRSGRRPRPDRQSAGHGMTGAQVPTTQNKKEELT